MGTPRKNEVGQNPLLDEEMENPPISIIHMHNLLGDANVANDTQSFDDEILDTVRLSVQGCCALLINLEPEELTVEEVSDTLAGIWDRNCHPDLFTEKTIQSLIRLIKTGKDLRKILSKFNPYRVLPPQQRRPFKKMKVEVH